MRSSSVGWAGFATIVAAGVVGWVGLERESRGDTYYYTPTAYYVPATAAVIGPAYEITTSPLIATTYTPSTYATVYTTPTVYLAPTGYLTRVYERGLFRRRRWVVERPLIASYAETAYLLPSTYVAPRYRATVYESPTAWESSYTVASAPICDDQVRPASVSSSAVEENLDPVAPRKSVASQATDEGTIPGKVGAPAPPVAKPPLPNAEAKKAPADTTPPIPTPAPREQSTIRPGAAVQSKPNPADAKIQNPSPPIAPADEKPGEIDLKPAPLEDDPGTVRRDSRKPTFDASRPLGAAGRGILMGAVETNTGEAREEVRVSVTSRDRLDLAHNGFTNAFGRFAIRLEDGEWTVNVTLPSGRRYAVRQISVRDGRIVDRDENRDIPNLIISF